MAINKLNDEQFKELIEDKRVAIVCPSKCIVGSKQKDLLESYDYIVRINRQHPVAENLVEDISNRTDILYNSNLGDASDNLIQNLESGNLNNIKCVVYPSDSMLRREFEDRAKTTGDIITYGYPWNLTHMMMKHAEQWEIKCPNQQHDFFVGHTGTIALYHILLQNPKEVYVTGMTWYRESYYDGYKEKEHQPSVEEKKQIWDKWSENETPKKLHNIDMDAEIVFFKRLKQECNIKNDKFMEDILNSNI